MNCVENESTNDLADDNVPFPVTANAKVEAIHYQELFGHLKVSYIEEDTREKYLRAMYEALPERNAAQTKEALNLKHKNLLQSRKQDLWATKAAVREIATTLIKAKNRFRATSDAAEIAGKNKKDLQESLKHLHELQSMRKMHPNRDIMHNKSASIGITRSMHSQLQGMLKDATITKVNLLKERRQKLRKLCSQVQTLRQQQQNIVTTSSQRMSSGQRDHAKLQMLYKLIHLHSQAIQA